MFEGIFGFVGSILNAVFPHILDRRGKKSDEFMQYQVLRREVAEALVYYSRLLYHPVDLAKTPNQDVPEDYQNGIDRFRELAAKMCALAETMPPKNKDMPVKPEELSNAAGCLIGLSNSFLLPYNTALIDEDLQDIRRYEIQLREILDISKKNGD